MRVAEVATTVRSAKSFSRSRPATDSGAMCSEGARAAGPKPRRHPGDVVAVPGPAPDVVGEALGHGEHLLDGGPGQVAGPAGLLVVVLAGRPRRRP